ncbi:helix-turn-helix transcriptional regulator [Nocardia sp. CC201C]|uniref:helix-turn-helix transcriptional regulator n=1 Tax=Nocardia sp. CC201C TaxID=3044575 RepID=UPI0024A8677E|nr:helix-turn-helix transcriptional regulator [Nocardia sp. CC201C]
MWEGTAMLRPGTLTYTGRIGHAHRHHHAAAQLVFATAGRIGVRDADGNLEEARAALIPAGQTHEMIGAATGLLIFADASSALGRALNTRVRETGLPLGSAAAWVRAAAPLDRTPLLHPHGEPPRADTPRSTRNASGVSAAERGAPVSACRCACPPSAPGAACPSRHGAAVGGPPAHAAAAAPATHAPTAGGSTTGTPTAGSGFPAGLLARLVGAEGGGTGPEHPALRRALALLPGMLDGPVRLRDLAEAVGISASRLGHLFAEEVGMGFPPYLRWARLRHAMEHARLGGTLTTAAHAAGFADSAHLTRVCHEMFGLAPSELVRRVALVRS